MKLLYSISFIFLSISIIGCSSSRKSSKPVESNASEIKSRVKLTGKVPARNIKTGNTSAEEVVSFAESLIGTPYTYGSAKKENGFDCSGFMYYVFTNFGIAVPRSSVHYTNAGKEVPIVSSKRGDIILFTGSDANSGKVGHMGIITQNKKGDIRFIHAASGNRAGVMISGMNRYFVERFVKVIRIFTVFE